jgi:hypothetical protein
MKVYVISRNSWNGEHDVKEAVTVTLTEEAAAAYCDSRNSSWKSSYAPFYEYDEFDTEN